MYANLDEASLMFAHLEGACLSETSLDKADLREATGVHFDDNSVFRTRIEGHAPDQWSVLRRKFTGPWFFFHLLLLVVFFAPYVGRVLALSAAAHGQEWLEQESEEVAATLDRNFEQVPAVRVLVGGTEGWRALSFAIVVVIYNALRLVLTLRVSMLRDAEERSAITPRLIDYRGMAGPRMWRRWRMRSRFLISEHRLDKDTHWVRRVLMIVVRPVLIWAVALLSVWGDRRWRRVWPDWRHAAVQRRWCGFLCTWMRLMPARLREHWDLGQMRGLGAFERLGLWRLHCIAKVLFWAAIISVAVSTLEWVFKTKVPVPIQMLA